MEFKHTIIVLQNATDPQLLGSLFTCIIRNQNTSLYNLFTFIGENVVSNFKIKSSKVELSRFDLAILNSIVEVEVENVDQALFRALCVAEKLGHNPTLLMICSDAEVTDLLISTTYLAESLGITISCVNLASKDIDRQPIREIAEITGGGYMEYNNNHGLLYFVMEKNFREITQNDEIAMLRCQKCEKEQLVGTLCNICGKISCEGCARSAKCCFCANVWE